jgi:trehalose-phosphatase
MEPTMEDFDTYLSNYVGDSEKFVLLLDYDGTLAPIAPHPNLTCMSEATKESLNRIANNPKIFTAVISGRGVDNVKEQIGIDGLICAGNHGLEILYPSGKRYNHQIPGDISSNFVKMVKALEKVCEQKFGNIAK